MRSKKAVDPPSSQIFPIFFFFLTSSSSSSASDFAADFRFDTPGSEESASLLSYSLSNRLLDHLPSSYNTANLALKALLFSLFFSPILRKLPNPGSWKEENHYPGFNQPRLPFGIHTTARIGSAFTVIFFLFLCPYSQALV